MLSVLHWNKQKSIYEIFVSSWKQFWSIEIWRDRIKASIICHEWRTRETLLEFFRFRYFKFGHTWENVPSDMCAQRRLRSACAFAQSDQSLRCSHEETSLFWLSKMRRVTILIRQCECAGLCEFSLGARGQRYVFWHWGPVMSACAKLDWIQSVHPSLVIALVRHT